MWISSNKRKRANSLSRRTFKFLRTCNGLLPPKLCGKNFNYLSTYTMLQVFTSFVGQEFHSCCSKVPRDVSQEAKDCFLDYVCYINASERSVTGKYFEHLITTIHADFVTPKEDAISRITYSLIMKYGFNQTCCSPWKTRLMTAILCNSTKKYKK